MGIAIGAPALTKRLGYIGGAWVGARSGATFAVRNPATGETLADVANMNADDARAAVEAAGAAFPQWRARSAKDRSRLLRRWYELIFANQNELALLLTHEQGKPLPEARGEVGMGAAQVEWAAEEAKRVYGDVIPSAAADKRYVVLKGPVGVCAGITPWNFPHSMVTRKVAPALAAGCTFVLKPAEQTPLSALALAALAEEAGIPAGVFNVVTGDAEAAPRIGAELTSNPLVRKLGFTGSTQVGKLLMAQCASTVKNVSLELGGNAPFIVFDDADVDAAVAGAMSSKFRNAGQMCISPNRILVQAGIHDTFVERLGAAVAKLRVGNGLEGGVDIGPLIEENGFAKVVEHVSDARSRGAKALLGGKPSALGRTFYEPTVLTGVSAEMLMSREETFGPVAGIASFHDDAAAIALSNATPYGLAAYFYTRDFGRAWRVAEALETGMVGVNTITIANEAAPFGGVKESGIGREGSK
ncbi:MAG: NAD-dependent succinate-semialdehyde dehydrogenase [Vulcanimicrobiaceae bacterium]